MKKQAKNSRFCINQTTLPIGWRISLPGHFDAKLVLEASRSHGGGYGCRVCLPDGTLDETAVLGAFPSANGSLTLGKHERLRICPYESTS
jgi:hypothetical protein